MSHYLIVPRIILRQYFDYVEYGAGGQTWESDAVSAGIWTTGDFVADVVAGSSIGLKADGMDNNMSSDWTQFNNPTPGSNNEPVPEPTTLALLCIGVLALGLLMNRKMKKNINKTRLSTWFR